MNCDNENYILWGRGYGLWFRRIWIVRMKTKFCDLDLEEDKDFCSFGKGKTVQNEKGNYFGNTDTDIGK